LIEQKESYHGKEITYSIPEDPSYNGDIHAQIGGHHVHIMKLIDGSYTTHLLPFRSYSSMQELTRDIMDKVPYYKMKQ
jgi:hypothetical protein